MHLFDDDMLVESSRLLRLTSYEENLAAVRRLAKKGKNNLALLSRTLKPSLYDDMDFVEEIKRLVLGNKFADIRIIVADPVLIMQRGHRLVELAMMLSSFIRIKKAIKQYKDFNEEILVVDEKAYFHRKNDSRYQTTLNFNDRRQSKSLLDQFDTIWAEAEFDPNLRRTML